jgi:hypothetical protein
MNQDPFRAELEGCEAVQMRISEAADEGPALPEPIEAHLQTCPACARFAQLWLEPGAAPVRELSEPVPASASADLRGRVLASVTHDHSRNAVVPFPVQTKPRAWWHSFGKLAAALAVGALAWWMLNPKVVEKPEEQAVASFGSNSLLHTVALAEKPMHHEKEALHRAALRGGKRLHETVAWTFAMLDQHPGSSSTNQ